MIVLIILFAAGIVFHLVPFTQPLVMKLTDVFLLFANTYVFWLIWKTEKNKALLFWSLLVFILTFLLEYAGVKTGKIFGNYHYGETMFLQLGNVPVVIAFNWLMLILATNSLAWFISRNRFLVPFIASLLIVIFDFVMEPVAMELDYWQWAGNVVPTQNYLAWFLIALAFSFLLQFFKLRIKSGSLNLYLGIQFVFFLVLFIW